MLATIHIHFCSSLTLFWDSYFFIPLPGMIQLVMSDLVSLSQVRTGWVFWPIMQAALHGDTFPNATSCTTSLEFCKQLFEWTMEKLAHNVTMMQDVMLDKIESVEKYHARLLQVFEYLGFFPSREGTNLYASINICYGPEGSCQGKPYCGLPCISLHAVARPASCGQGIGRIHFWRWGTSCPYRDSPRTREWPPAVLCKEWWQSESSHSWPILQNKAASVDKPQWRSQKVLFLGHCI